MDSMQENIKNIRPGLFYSYVFEGIKTDSRTPKIQIQARKTKNRALFAFLNKDQKLTVNFRAVLRQLKANSLENELFGNHEDPVGLPSEYYQFPDEMEIHDKFDAINAQYAFFSDDNTKPVRKQFRILFSACKLIADYIECNNTPENDLAFHNAYKIAVISEATNTHPFSSIHLLMQACQSPKPLHDALLPALPFNTPPLRDRKGWQKFIKHYPAGGLEIFQLAFEIEEKTGGKAPGNMAETREILSRIVYARYDENPELALICKQYKLTESHFNQCLALEKTRKTREYFRKLTDERPETMIEGFKYGDARSQALVYFDDTKCDAILNPLYEKWEHLTQKPEISQKDFFAFLWPLLPDIDNRLIAGIGKYLLRDDLLENHRKERGLHFWDWDWRTIQFENFASRIDILKEKKVLSPEVYLFLLSKSFGEGAEIAMAQNILQLLAENQLLSSKILHLLRQNPGESCEASPLCLRDSHEILVHLKANHRLNLENGLKIFHYTKGKYDHRLLMRIFLLLESSPLKTAHEIFHENIKNPLLFDVLVRLSFRRLLTEEVLTRVLQLLSDKGSKAVDEYQNEVLMKKKAYQYGNFFLANPDPADVTSSLQTSQQIPVSVTFHSCKRHN